MLSELENFLTAFRLIALNLSQFNIPETKLVLFDVCFTIGNLLRNSFKDLKFIGDNTIESKFLFIFFIIFFVRL